jgi:hypothetical protein
MNDIERLLDSALAGRRVHARPSLTDVHRRVRHLRRRNVAVKSSGLLAVGAGAVAMIVVRDPGSTPVGDAPAALPCDTVTLPDVDVSTTTNVVPLTIADVVIDTTIVVDPTTTMLGVVPGFPASTTTVEPPDTGPAAVSTTPAYTLAPTTTTAPDGAAPTTTDCVVEVTIPTSTILAGTTVDATVMPDLTGLTSEEMSRVLYDELALDVVANTIVAEGVDAATDARWVVSGQTPAPGAPLVAGQTVEVVFIPTNSSLDTLPPITSEPTAPPATTLMPAP